MESDRLTAAISFRSTTIQNSINAFKLCDFDMKAGLPNSVYFSEVFRFSVKQVGMLQNFLVKFVNIHLKFDYAI